MTRQRARNGRQLRVTLVIGQLGLGGTEQQVALLAVGLRDAGCEVTVVTLFGAGPHADALRQEPGVALAGPWLPAVPGPVRLLLLTLRLAWELRVQRPDVVHAFLLGAYVLAGPAAWAARVPLRIAGRRSLADFKDGHPGQRLAERLTNPAFHAFVANAEAVAVDAVRSERLPAGRMHVIHNALPAKAFTSSPPPADLDVTAMTGRRIVCVANLLRYKGHRFLLDACGLLRDAGHDTTLVLVGDGPERRNLEEQAARLDLDVRLLGARGDVNGVLGAAEVVVLPSLHEGMSNALMEAMARGRPIVATDVGGNREVIGASGILCPPADPVALRDALLSLLLDEARATALGAEGRRRAEEQFTLAQLVTRHLRLYDGLLTGSPIMERRSGSAP